MAGSTTNSGNRRRRGAGEGTIRQRDNGLWEARITLENGKRLSLYGDTRQDVAKRLAAAIRDQEAGVLLARDERQTVGRWLVSWLETAKPSIEPTTYERYELNVRLHLIPALGRVRLAKLTPQQVQWFLADELNAGAAPRSVRNMRAQHTPCACQLACYRVTSPRWRASLRKADRRYALKSRAAP